MCWDARQVSQHMPNYRASSLSCFTCFTCKNKQANKKTKQTKQTNKQTNKQAKNKQNKHRSKTTNKQSTNKQSPGQDPRQHVYCARTLHPLVWPGLSTLTPDLANWARASCFVVCFASHSPFFASSTSTGLLTAAMTSSHILG